MTKKFTPKYGIYKCKIDRSKDDDLNRIFSFNYDNTYTHEDIESANRIGLKVKIIDESPNCYIYDKKDLMPMSEIFGDYMKFFFDLKIKKMPYSKMFLSHLHGFLAEKYRIKLTVKSE